MSKHQLSQEAQLAYNNLLENSSNDKSFKTIEEYIGWDNLLKVGDTDNDVELLMNAANHGLLNVVKFLKIKGVNINTPANGNWTALHWASLKGKTEVVRYLLENEANPNFRNLHGKTPLQFASEAGKIEVVKLLVEQGKATADSKDTLLTTPLHEASGQGHIDVVKYLVEAGSADVNSKTGAGRTPLHEASYGCHKDVVVYLLSKGANPLIKITSGDQIGAKASDLVRNNPMNLHNPVLETKNILLEAEKKALQNYPTAAVLDPNNPNTQEIRKD